MTRSIPRSRRCPTPWLGRRYGFLSDRLTQLWVRATGQRVTLSQEPWLGGPSGATDVIGQRHFERLAQAEGLELRVNARGSGLLACFDKLRSPGFDTDSVDPRIKEFYENTSCYCLDAWSQWCGVFRPLGRLLAFIFSRRLEQLNVPLSPLATSRGITSDILQLVQLDSGEVLYTGWLRRFADTGEVIYAAHYSLCAPRRLGIPCMRVVFPLPNGNATVVMKPEVHEDGSITVSSSGSKFGDAGFYFVVQENQGTVQARFVRTMREQIHVYAEQDGTLRADHVFRIWGVIFLQIHYKMTKLPDVSQDNLYDP